MRKVLIANRGEIAVRIMKTCREMGLKTIALTAENDTASHHTNFADECVDLGGGTHQETFLNIERIVGIAKERGAFAIHPGYGFLSENAAFSEAVEAAGIQFVGPKADSIRAMGLKREAKLLVAEAGVPVVPGYSGEDQSPQTLKTEAEKIGFPLLIKASAGGGGKGMKIVRSSAEFETQLDSAKREAKSAFGNDFCILEKYVSNPRHVEIQIFGDGKGKVVALGERECSIQRRHQKIIEEAPSPAVTPALRKEMCEAAIRAGQAVQYRNAGTVEFILDDQDQFYFMEMNTRLQVEHPVTEMVMGLDLVRLQLETAMGNPLTLEAIREPRGWAIEARVYAEDPNHEFLPQTGSLIHCEWPTGIGVRVDAGVQKGSVVGMDYDPMLAKVIAFGPDREAAIERLIHALHHTFLHGVQSNIAFLVDILQHQGFRSGALTTHFIQEHMQERSVSQPHLKAALGLALVNAPASPSHNPMTDQKGILSPWAIEEKAVFP